MTPAAERFAEILDSSDRALLAELARHLWDECHAIAGEWAAAAVAALPEFFPVGSPTRDLLHAVNEAFLSLVLDRMRDQDLEGLAHAYYEMNRRLIDADLGRVVGRPLSLSALYTSAQLALDAIERRLDGAPPRLVRVFGRVATRLMMLVGLAYSDSREEALRHGHEALERVVAERTAELVKAKALADTIIETLPGIFFLIDHDERLVRWNEELQKVSGYDGATLARRHPLEFFDDETRPMLRDKMHEAFTAGASSAEADLIAR